MIRICSYGSDHADRRSPNYEVPVGVLFPGGQPLPYAVAQQLFKVRGRAPGLAPVTSNGPTVVRVHPSVCWA